MGTFQAHTGKSIDASFAQFDKKNPLVWKKFESEVFKAIRLGRTKISAKQLIGYIRWYVSIQTTDPKWKINDAFTSRYARKFAEKNKAYQHIFEYRELRSGTETLKKQFLSPPEITVLKRAHAGYIVKVGKSSDNVTEILSGLSANDIIVTEGVNSIADGMKLNF